MKIESLIKLFEEGLEDAKEGNIRLLFMHYLKKDDTKKGGTIIEPNFPLSIALNEIKFLSKHMQESIIECYSEEELNQPYKPPTPEEESFH